MTIQWHPDALAEADAATEFYRAKRRGLAQRFLGGLEEALRRVEQHPHIYREIKPGIRKCRIKAFPYALVFRDGSTIEIVAVVHIRQEPGYWRGRI